MIKSPLLQALEEGKKKCLQQICDIKKMIASEQSKILIDCTFCKKEHMIGDLTYIQTHWYVQPFSCSGGDYWNEGEGNFKCPACKNTNRLYNRKEYEELKNRFKDISKTYERYQPLCT